MRSFFVLLLISVFLSPLTAFAEAKQGGLFKIELVKTEASSFDKLLNKAIRIELVRLSGSKGILTNEAAKFFIKQPKSWLKSFSYVPIYSEGVQTGQKIEFTFAKERLYQQFQKSNLIIWPLNRRPKILVLGAHYLDSSATYLTQTTLQYRSDINFMPYARNRSLPLQVPKNNHAEPNLNSDLDRQVLKESMKAQNIKYVLSLKSKQDLKGSVQVSWILLDNQLNSVEQGQLGGGAPVLRYYGQMINQIMEWTSKKYRQNAGILGEITLQVSGINRYDKLASLEAFLKQQKPTFRQVRLLSQSQDVGTFDIVYQGKLETSMNLLQKNTHLGGIVNDAFIGQLQAEWQ